MLQILRRMKHLDVFRAFFLLLFPLPFWHDWRFRRSRAPFPGSSSARGTVCMGRAYCCWSRTAGRHRWRRVFWLPAPPQDTRTGQLTLAAVDRHPRQRTSFLITFRLCAIRNADLIPVLQKEDITEQGSFEARMAAGGFTTSFHSSQFGKVSTSQEGAEVTGPSPQVTGGVHGEGSRLRRKSKVIRPVFKKGG